MSMAEWGAFWTAVGVVVAILVGLAGGLKLLWELKELRERAEEDASLKRTEFFLEQHRRLFDDENLSEVLRYLDADDPEFAKEHMWDKKRKFLTFIEEIALLVNSGKINDHVAYYMFGYYARCACGGANFLEGIDTDPGHWWMFYKFCEDSKKFEESTAALQHIALRL